MKCLCRRGRYTAICAGASQISFNGDDPSCKRSGMGIKMKKNSFRVFVIWMIALCIAGCSRSQKSPSSGSGDVSSDSVVMMVGDQQVRYSEVQAYCYFLKCQYEESFGSEIWSYPVSESETIGDQAKQEIVNMITQLKIISEEAQKRGIGLDADARDEALRQAEDLVRDASAKDKKKYVLSVQSISRIYQENALADKMFYVVTDSADTHVTDEEARQVALKNMREADETDEVGSEDTSRTEQKVSQEAISQAKEQIIEERQTDMFVETYSRWTKDRNVDINQAFWNAFSL